MNVYYVDIIWPAAADDNGGDNHETKISAVKCCSDNHIGECTPGSGSETRCNNLCKQNSCTKGGVCKVDSQKPHNQYCHCVCDLWI